MKQKISIPLLRDHHNHPSIYGALYDCIDLQETRDKKKAVDMLSALDKETVSVVLGWNSGFYTFSPEELKRFPPVVIVNISLHSFIMTPSAEDILREKYPGIVANYKDASWYEKYFPGLLIFLANLAEFTEEKMKTFFDHLFRLGVYYAEEMHLPGENVLSIIRSSSYAERTAFWTNPDTFKTLSAETQKHIKGLKFFTDGALGAGTAAMKEPYRNGKMGELLFSDRELYRVLADGASTCKAAAIHALGESASAQVVRTLRKLNADGIWFPLVRMEHCQFIDEADACVARDLGVILSMQPNFSIDSTIYADRLQGHYLEWNNPFRMLIDRVGFVPGEDLILGSDGMPQGAEEALHSSLFPPFPQQRLTLDEFIAGYGMPDKSYGQVEVEIDDGEVKISSNSPNMEKV
ncbi:MAG: amidohydrolase family protein [bacterium]|nr:amidohydrolase family protein [bacterium]